MAARKNTDSKEPGLPRSIRKERDALVGIIGHRPATSTAFVPAQCNRPRMFDTQAALNRAIELWKERLQLRDWTIYARIVDQWDVVNELGSVKVHLVARQAFVDLAPKSAHEALMFKGQLADMERSLVHEMIHIYFHPIWPAGEESDSLKIQMGELAVDGLANVIVNAYRLNEIIPVPAPSGPNDY